MSIAVLTASSRVARIRSRAAAKMPVTCRPRRRVATVGGSLRGCLTCPVGDRRDDREFDLRVDPERKPRRSRRHGVQGHRQGSGAVSSLLSLLSGFQHRRLAPVAVALSSLPGDRSLLRHWISFRHRGLIDTLMSHRFEAVTKGSPNGQVSATLSVAGWGQAC